MTTNRNQKNTQNTANRGFASMDPEKQHEIASKGGHASAEKAGHEGMAERGRKGGEKRAEQLGHAGYVELGRKGGEARAEQLGHEGYVALGRKGGESRNASTSQSNKSQDENNNSRRGFASQPKSKLQEAARKGGQHSKGGRSFSTNDED